MLRLCEEIVCCVICHNLNILSFFLPSGSIRYFRVRFNYVAIQGGISLYAKVSKQNTTSIRSVEILLRTGFNLAYKKDMTDTFATQLHR